VKKIGIVGGVGWRSTVEYYSEICRRADAWHAEKTLTGTPSTPEIVIESLDLAKAFALLGKDENEGSWERFDAYHRGALWRLETAGADVALMASNTPHHRFNEIVRGVGIPVISILDAAAEECRSAGARRVLVLGTALAMRSPKFRAAFTKHGIELVPPVNDVARARTVTLIAELQRGRVKGAAVRMGKIVAASWRFPGEPVVCLACTELPLAFPGFTTQASFKYGGVTYINTTAAHIDAVLQYVGIPAEKRSPARGRSGPGERKEISVVSAAATAAGRSAGTAADGSAAADTAATMEAAATAAR
jgi:aspartate racemase